MENKGFLFVVIVCTFLVQTQCFSPFGVGHQSLQSRQAPSDCSSSAECFYSNNCEAPARETLLRCSSRDGSLCLTQVSRASGALLNASQSCPSSSNCSSNCQAAINVLKNDLGCCFILFNTTFVAGTAFNGSGSLFATFSDSNLWQQCGVTPPGVCPSSAAGNTVFSVLAVILLVICNVYFVCIY